MRNYILSTVLMVLSTLLFAQAPSKMSYQAVIRNNGDGLVVNHAIGMRISILQGSSSGTVVYTETQTPTTNANGLVSIEIGGGTGFDVINWANGPYFLKTETDPTGGTSYTITGTSQILSVPYALQAKTAGTADYNSLTNLPTLNITNWNTSYGWGNHSGLYRPLSWVPAWTDVTGKPNFATVATSGSYTDLSNKPTILNSQWTTSGSNIYYNAGNVGIGTSSPATLIHAHGSPVTSRGQLSLSSPAGQDIFLSFYEANTFKSYLWFNVADQDLRLQNFTAGDLNLNPYGGNVGIGTITPGAKLEVAGQVKITGGTPAAGQILTSDGTGLATWEPPAAVTPNQIYFEVKRNASYDWPTNATVKKIDFSSNSTVWENQGNAFNATTSTFTAPENGIYSFNGAIHFESITAGYLIYAMLTAGGRTYEGEWKYSSSSFDGVTISITLYLSVGQTAQLWGYLNDPTPPGLVYGNTAVDYAFTFFSGAKVR